MRALQTEFIPAGSDHRALGGFPAERTVLQGGVDGVGRYELPFSEQLGGRLDFLLLGGSEDKDASLLITGVEGTFIGTEPSALIVHGATVLVYLFEDGGDD